MVESRGIIWPFSMLWSYIQEDRKCWDEPLSALVASCNASIHESTGVSPHCLLYGSPLCLLLDLSRAGSPNDLHFTISIRWRISTDYRYLRSGWSELPDAAASVTTACAKADTVLPWRWIRPRSDFFRGCETRILEHWQRWRDGKHHGGKDSFVHFNNLNYVFRFAVLTFVLAFDTLACLRLSLCTAQSLNVPHLYVTDHYIPSHPDCCVGLYIQTSIGKKGREMF